MNPWPSIPAGDYEGHMGPGGADQLAPLAAILGRVYAAARPVSVAAALAEAAPVEAICRA